MSLAKHWDGTAHLLGLSAGRFAPFSHLFLEFTNGKMLFSQAFVDQIAGTWHVSTRCRPNPPLAMPGALLTPPLEPAASNPLLLLSKLSDGSHSSEKSPQTVLRRCQTRRRWFL